MVPSHFASETGCQPPRPVRPGLTFRFERTVTYADLILSSRGLVRALPYDARLTIGARSCGHGIWVAPAEGLIKRGGSP